MDLGTIIIWALATWGISNTIILITKLYSKSAKEMEARVKAHINEIIHRVKVEIHSGMHYWFDEDDDEFLAQGTTADEVIERISKRYPDHYFLLNYKDQDYVIAAKTEWKPVKYDIKHLVL